MTENEKENAFNTEQIQNEQFEDVAVIGKELEQETANIHDNCHISTLIINPGSNMNCPSLTNSHKYLKTKPKRNKTKEKYIFKNRVKEEGIELGSFGKSYWVAFGLGGGKGSDRSDKMFLILVFGTLLAMLAFTAIVNIIVYTVEPLRDFFRQLNFVFPLLIGVVLLAVALAMGCIECARKCPVVAVLITIGVIATTLLCCYVTARYRTEVIFLAFVSTSIIVFICTIIAVFGFDFTTYLIYIIIVALAVSVLTALIFLVMHIFNIKLTWLALTLLVIGVIVQSVMFIVELQMILGGRTVELEESDWGIGAFMLYTSIIDIFIKLVQIFGILDD